MQSWLHDAKSYSFAAAQVSPVYLSQHGFQNLANGECDIACTDRPITPRELEQFGDRELQGYRVAFYGYALYVHPDNPVDAIYANHMKLIFQRRITDWHELAGDEIPAWQGPIQLYGPDKETRGGMILSPLARIWFAEATWTVLESDAEIIAAVAADPYALGFAGIGYEDGVRYLGLRMKRTGSPAFPSLEEIESERYGLAKVIYVYFILPADPTVQAVLDYLWSDEGRAAIEATNLWAIPPNRATVPIPAP
ncbi:MAG: substrate-binding domain-containing protein [Phycisphaerae bacterium]|nr:substrate-binding domain-containing protein [Phycisphaerae bacterium]